MTVEAFRIQNFMGFQNSGWLELRPITLLFGRNSSGKSALIRSLLLLRQSLESPIEMGALLFVRDDGFDFGDYLEIVRDHDPQREISFWFKCRFWDSDTNLFLTRSLDAMNQLVVPAYVPPQNRPKSGTVTVRLIFGQRFALPSHLRAIDIFDEMGNIAFRATLRSDRRNDKPAWEFSSEFFDLSDQPEPNFWPYMEMFTKAGFLPWIRPLQSQLDQAEEEDDELTKGALGEAFHLIWLILRGVRSSIGTFLQGINYLGPLRAEPQRFYYVAGQGAVSVSRGQHLVRSLMRAEASSLQAINDWLASSGMKVQINLTPLDARQTLYELRLVENAASDAQAFSANLREVGFGLTQALPIVTQAILTPLGQTLVIEQPELHLHPRAQAELGDLFISIAQQGVRFLIETHSEHLLLRLQKQIARTTAGEIPVGERGKMLLPNQLAVYFVNRKDGVSTATQIEVGPYGDLLSTPEGFEDFFSDDMIETAERMRVRLAGMRKDG